MFEKVSGQRIKKAIKDAGYTQKEFVKKIGLANRSIVSQWITGAYNPSLKSLEKIAVTTGKPISYFFDSVGGEVFEVFGHQGQGSTVNINNSLEKCKKDTEMELMRKDSELLKKDKEIELMRKNSELLKKDKEIELMRKDNELLKKDMEMELLKKDMEIELLKKDTEMELLKKDMEALKLKTMNY
jgi:transcriptional regulator with XRE-family HTH domain